MTRGASVGRAAWPLAVATLLVSSLLGPAPALAAADTADAASIQDLGHSRSGSAVCGAYTLSWSNAPPASAGGKGSATIRIDGGGGSSFSVDQSTDSPSETLEPMWCGDVLGDGSMALAYAWFSGGAHCCSTVTVQTLGAQGRRLLQADLGNAGGLQPVQLGDAGPLQLLSSSDVFAYFDDLSFFASPFLPMIVRYDGQQYVEATSAYPAYLRAQLNQALGQLGTLPAQVPSSGGPDLAQLEHESVALRVLGLYTLLGDPQAGQSALERQLSRPVASWLATNAGAAVDALQQAYHLAA